MNARRYRLPGPKPEQRYVVELYAGCPECVTPPGVVISLVTPDPSDDSDEYLDDLPVLPLRKVSTGAGGPRECVIRCGMDVDEFVTAAAPTRSTTRMRATSRTRCGGS